LKRLSSRSTRDRRRSRNRIARWFACALPWLIAPLLCGCFKRDYPADRKVISDVEIEDGNAVDADDLLDGLATQPSSRFFGIWEGVAFDYETFDANVLARDLERVERYYHARGYYEAKVTAARVIHLDDHHVRVMIRVYEGAPVRVKNVDFQGLEKVPIEIGAQVYRVNKLQRGEPFDEENFEQTRKALEQLLGDGGYAFAKIKSNAIVDIARREVVVTYAVDPGPPAHYGPINVVGLQEIPEGPVRSALLIKPGQPYSRAELKDVEDTLVNMGVFATVEVRQDRTKPESREVPITILVRESSLRTLQLGGGAKFNVVELTTYLRTGWEDRNFLGGMRHFQIDTRPGVTFFPTRLDQQYLQAPTAFLPQNRLRVELRQPSFFEGRTTGFVAGEFNIYPLLYPLPDDIIPEDEKIIGYYEVRTQLGVERAFFGHHLYLTPSYNWQANFPFLYQPSGGDPLIDRILVSFPELHSVLDFRDDPISPHKGFYLSNSFQVAVKLGGDLEDVRIRPEARIYLPMSRPVTLALRTGIGFLFPMNYGDRANDVITALTTDAEREEILRDQQALLFRGFFSGGPDSNRGYAYRGVGPQGPVGFLIPTGANCDAKPLPDACIRPLGGLTLWEASMEVRFRVSGPLHGVVFVDSSDVTRSQGQFRFTVPHISVGPGLRYATPVGPLRLDIGWAVPWLQKIGEDKLPPEEGRTAELFGLPVGVHIAFGEAF